MRLSLAALLVWAFAVRAWFATPELDAGRFWDERFALENVEALLRDGRWLPVNAYHPSLAHLPQAAVLAVPHALAEATGEPSLAVLRPGRGFTPLAYLLVRLVQALFGTLSILWLYRVGRRLFDARVGLLAAVLLAVTPWHLRQSAIFKPDILLVLLELVAFEWALSAFDRPRAGRFARAGFGVGLAMAAKYNGVAAALPLIAGWLFGPGRRAAFGRMALAGAIAVATFLLLDPHLVLRPEMLAQDFGLTLRHYAREAAIAGAGRVEVVAHAFRTLGGSSVHGRVIGATALGGLLWLGLAAVRAAPRHRRRLAMLLAFPVGYVLLYVTATTNPSDHNWLPLVPFTALAAAAAVVAAGRAIARRWPLVRRSQLLPIAVCAGALLLAAQSTAYVYRVVLPSTWQLADGLLLAGLGRDSGHRLVWQEGLDRYRVGRRAPRRRKPILISPAAALAAGVAPRAADARVHLAAPGTGGGGDAGSAESLWLRPRPFHAHGPALRLVFHPWRSAGAPVTLTADADGSFVVPATPGGRDRMLTLEVITAGGGPPAAGLAVEWGGRRVPLLWAGTRVRGRHRWATPRLAAPAAPSTLRVVGRPPPEVVRVDLLRWLPPAVGPPADAPPT